MSSLISESDSLAKKIEKPLEISKKRKVTELIDDSDDEVNEEQEKLNDTVTNETRQKIYTILKDINREEIDNNEKMLDIISKINNFSEEQAQVYLEMLSCVHSHKMNASLAKRLIHLIASYSVHENDYTSVEDMEKDEHIMSTLTNYLGFIFAKLGNISGIVIFMTYIFYSHYVYGGKKTSITEAAVQNDGERTQPDGENNINGKAIDNRMGE